MQLNEVLEKLPKHLLNLVIDQPYNDYTAQDHAVWRYVMRQNVKYLSKVAHHSYLDGLNQAGISIDRIPHMYGMNRILKKIGWAAVAVDGFIPPAAFMEFQAYNVLVIAADIRPFDQIEYTPAPDIIHEAAGHAPIIADPEYAAYLQLFGEIGSKAFSSAHNYRIYEAVRHLSILKADPYSSVDDIKKAEFDLAELSKNTEINSEMSLIRNLHWWTVEYGLIGDLDNPKIYGAGLLSSIGESHSSLQAGVKKIIYTIEAANQGFDITTRQPQLFVTPDFETLSDVLDRFACNMALRRGGLYGINKAIESENIATAEYASGLQLTGVFTSVIGDNGNPVFIKTEGPTALSFENIQLQGHDKSYHAFGFSSPVGKISGNSKPIELMTVSELSDLGIINDQNVQLTFESGVKVSGKVLKISRKKGKVILVSFVDCTVEYKDQVLFEPDWGVYDMAVGATIYSVFSGAADPDSFNYYFEPPKEKTHKIVHDEKAIKLHGIYQSVRDIRESENGNIDLQSIFESLKTNYSDDCLLIIELLELAIIRKEIEFSIILTNYLEDLKKDNPQYDQLITNGIENAKLLTKDIQAEQ